MSSALTERSERRIALQAQSSAGRRELRQAWGDIEYGVEPVDRLVGAARRLLPLAAVVGTIIVIVVGPAKALVTARRGLAVAIAAREAMRLVRGFRG